MLVQPVDEFNRPAKADYGQPRVPPRDEQIEALFGAWRDALPGTRKFLPAARDYLAASLWRRVGLRITETAQRSHAVGTFTPRRRGTSSRLPGVAAADDGRLCRAQLVRRPDRRGAR